MRRLTPWWLRRLVARRLVRYVPIVVRSDLEGLSAVTVERLAGGWVRVKYECKPTRDKPFHAHKRGREAD